MTTHRRTWPALAALAAILAITAVWWALALWPVADDTPSWVLRTRAACFGTTLDGLPNAGGWMLLLGQPIGMLIMLLAVWPVEVRAGIRTLSKGGVGQIALGTAGALLVTGLVAAAGRVIDARGEPFSVGERDVAASLTRVNDALPALGLVDQAGNTVEAADFAGRVTLVTFAYAHCETVCPLIVTDVVDAARRLDERAPDIVVITLDPWRDTPSRLASMAEAWRLPEGARVLSGPVERVERVLNAWRIPRIRNEQTGALSHPSLVYVVGADARIHYVVQGNPDVIAAAVGQL